MNSNFLAYCQAHPITSSMNSFFVLYWESLYLYELTIVFVLIEHDSILVSLSFYKPHYVTPSRDQLVALPIGVSSFNQLLFIFLLTNLFLISPPLPFSTPAHSQSQSSNRSLEWVLVFVRVGGKKKTKQSCNWLRISCVLTLKWLWSSCISFDSSCKLAAKISLRI